MSVAVPAMRKDDPTAASAVKMPKSKGHHTWTDDEIEQQSQADIEDLHDPAANGRASYGCAHPSSCRGRRRTTCDAAYVVSA